MVWKPQHKITYKHIHHVCANIVLRKIQCYVYFKSTNIGMTHSVYTIYLFFNTSVNVIYVFYLFYVTKQNYVNLFPEVLTKRKTNNIVK